MKSPDAWSPGWMTLIINRSIAASGYVTSYSATSPTSASFAGQTGQGVPFVGSIANGNLSVQVGSSTTQVNSNHDSDDACEAG